MTAAISIQRAGGTAHQPATPIPGSDGGAKHDELREVCTITRSTVQAAIEVLAGTRPVNQLARRLDQKCLTALQHRAFLTRREAVRAPRKLGGLHRNPAVRSVRACEVTPDIYEASAVVIDELRARAVALRLERSKQIWRVTALEIG